MLKSTAELTTFPSILIYLHNHLAIILHFIKSLLHVMPNHANILRPVRQRHYLFTFHLAKNRVGQTRPDLFRVGAHCRILRKRNPWNYRNWKWNNSTWYIWKRRTFGKNNHHAKRANHRSAWRNQKPLQRSQKSDKCGGRWPLNVRQTESLSQ